MIENFLSTSVIEQIVATPNDKEYAYILRFGALVPLQNFSTSPKEIIFDSTTIQPGDQIIHTHFGESMNGWLSNEDIQTALSLGIGTFLYHVDFQVWDYFSPDFPHPYPLKTLNPKKLVLQDFYKLSYSPYRCNCYTMIRDYAKGVLRINYPYINIDSGEGHFDQFFKDPASMGFKKREGQYQIGDVVILYVSPEIPYHVAIIVSLQPYRLMLHVLSPKRSSEPIRVDVWKRNIVSVWTI